MKCDWDSSKYERNLQRHGLAFELAEKVFDDPFAITTEDYINERGEQRYQTIAVYEGAIFLIAHTYRLVNGEERPRIISFRKAATYEEQKYYQRR